MTESLRAVCATFADGVPFTYLAKGFAPVDNWLTILPALGAHIAGAARLCVALESTVISHGLPYPQNLELALRVEEIVREQGACLLYTSDAADDLLCVDLG